MADDNDDNRQKIERMSYNTATKRDIICCCRVLQYSTSTRHYEKTRDDDLRQTGQNQLHFSTSTATLRLWRHGFCTEDTEFYTTPVDTAILQYYYSCKFDRSLLLYYNGDIILQHLYTI